MAWTMFGAGMAVFWATKIIIKNKISNKANQPTRLAVKGSLLSLRIAGVLHLLGLMLYVAALGWLLFQYITFYGPN